jgi:hypothetical protein
MLQTFVIGFAGQPLGALDPDALEFLIFFNRF